VTVATSPLVTAYLADLDRALAGADPADRIEIVDAVREHIDAELGASPTQAEIAAVLRRLGTADDVAAAWAVGADRPPAPRPQLRPSAHCLVPIPPDEAARQPTPPWVVGLFVILGALFGVPLLLGLLGALLLIPVRSSGDGTSSGLSTTAWWIVLAVLVVGTVVVGLVRRRARTHRRTWLAVFVVGLVLVAATLYYGLVVGGSFGSGVQVGPIEHQNVPTPRPGTLETP
jgi:hypothetical protein